jgi:hypothetical protein
MAKEETMIPNQQNANMGQSYDEVLANMSIEQKDNTIKQLDRQCGMLAQENIKLKQQMQQMQQSEFYIILDWNYKVATDTSGSFSNSFRKACANRVEEMLTPQEENKENSNG